MKGMLGMEEKAQPKNANASFLGKAPEPKRELTVATTGGSTTGTTTEGDQYACVDQTLYQMVRWLPASSQTWFQATDSLMGTAVYGNP
jgi:hypothetical protein